MPAQRLDELGLGLVAGFGHSPLEVGDERRAERRVGFRPGEDLVEGTSEHRDLLRGPHPPLWGWLEQADQPADVLLVENLTRRHRCVPDLWAGPFLPSS